MLKRKMTLLLPLLAIAVWAHAETFSSVTVQNNLTVQKSANVSGNITGANITSLGDVSTPVVKTNQVQASNGLTLQANSGNIELATQLVNVWGGLATRNNISTSQDVSAGQNIQAGGNITATGTMTASAINFSAQKMCSGVSAGEFRTGIIVPNTWTAATCKGWIIDQKVANDYPLGCVTGSGVSYGSLGGGTPGDNSCGW